MEIELTEEEAERIKRYVPTTVKRRKLILDSIVRELSKRNFKSLNETKKEDLQKVSSFVSDMYPESNYYTVREYAKVAIRLWNRTKK